MASATSASTSTRRRTRASSAAAAAASENSSQIVTFPINDFLEEVVVSSSSPQQEVEVNVNVTVQCNNDNNDDDNVEENAEGKGQGNKKEIKNEIPETELTAQEKHRARRIKANDNEKRRMEAINLGFGKLHSLIPPTMKLEMGVGRKPSKAEILQTAARAIEALQVEVQTMSAQLTQKNIVLQGLELRANAEPVTILAEAAAIHLPTPANSVPERGIETVAVADQSIMPTSRGNQTDEEDYLPVEKKPSSRKRKTSCSRDSDEYDFDHPTPRKHKRYGNNSKAWSSAGDIQRSVDRNRSCCANDAEIKYLRRRVVALEESLDKERDERAKLESELEMKNIMVCFERIRDKRHGHGHAEQKQAEYDGISQSESPENATKYQLLKPVSYSSVLTDQIINQVPDHYGIRKENLHTILKAIQHVESGPQTHEASPILDGSN